MPDHKRTAVERADGAIYRPAGALTITRAATTQREIDALPDPLTIDLSNVERMDTVGAWIIYRTVRDRGAKVDRREPRSRPACSTRSPSPTCRCRFSPEQRPGFIRVLTELGEWVADAGHTLVGLLGFFGATLIAFANRDPPARSASGSTPSSSASTWSASARSGSSG